MLVTIIFFLLLSTTFIQYNKLTIPPSKTSIVTDSAAHPMQARMLFIQISQTEGKLILQWVGTTPGVYVQKLSLNDDRALAEKAHEFAKRYKETFKDERTLQLGLGPKINYSKLITIMDSARDFLPDIVLLSHIDSETEGKKITDEAKND